MRLVSCLVLLAIAGCSAESTDSAANVTTAVPATTAAQATNTKDQAVAGAAVSASGSVEVGSIAPGFELPGSDGQTHSLSDYAGQHVVVAFFPKAFTGG